MEGFLKFVTEIARGFSRLTPGRQVAFLSVVVLSLAAIAVLFHFLGQTNYVVLYSDLSPEDSGTIAIKLQEKNVPYKVSYSGDRVMVPSDRVSELRIELASSGLPLGGGVGFEIFDEKNFGVTEFVQKLNYQRALQGELARTISGLDEITSSRVHIVLPEKSIFAETREQPTASVALRLKPGRRLQSSQVDGIVNLVARSVEGLNPENVMVVDSSGVMLSAAPARSEEGLVTGTQLEYQRTIEQELASRVQSMVERVVGSGRAIASASVRLDFTEIQKRQEIFDPDDPVVRSTHRKVERSTEPVSARESTVDPTISGEGNASRSASRERTDEVIHYELSRTISTSTRPRGEIEQISVAVLVDGSYRPNEVGEQVYVPRSAEELEQLDDLIKKAVGFNQRRGDQVVITNIPFDRTEISDDEFVIVASWKDTLDGLMPIIKAVLTLAALLAVILFVLRPMSRMLIAAGRAPQQAPATALPQGTGTASLADLQRQREQLNMEQLDMDESEDVRLVKNMARQDTLTFTELIRSWLK